jgi:osomolarity two-component system response regulator SKN7
LDNIRRKAPAPRKSTQILDEPLPTQQMDLVNTQLVATQQQLQQLQERYNELSMHHSLLLQELIGVQKTVVNHEHVMQNVMNFLHQIDAKQRRDSRLGGAYTQNAENNAVANADSQLPPPDDEPASPLANASKLLNDLNADVQLNYKNLEHMNELHNRTISITTPPPDGGRTGRAPTSAASSSSMTYSKLNGDLDTVVYPPGQTNGIDPMYSEHIHNIPYPMPSKDNPNDPRNQFDMRKKSAQLDPGWIRPPQILLVEDDPTCRRIGSKFLYSFHCAIDSAVSKSVLIFQI